MRLVSVVVCTGVLVAGAVFGNHIQSVPIAGQILTDNTATAAGTGLFPNTGQDAVSAADVRAASRGDRQPERAVRQQATAKGDRRQKRAKKPSKARAVSRTKHKSRKQRTRKSGPTAGYIIQPARGGDDLLLAPQAPTGKKPLAAKSTKKKLKSSAARRSDGLPDKPRAKTRQSARAVPQNPAAAPSQIDDLLLGPGKKSSPAAKRSKPAPKQAKPAIPQTAAKAPAHVDDLLSGSSKKSGPTRKLAPTAKPTPQKAAPAVPQTAARAPSQTDDLLLGPGKKSAPVANPARAPRKAKPAVPQTAATAPSQNDDLLLGPNNKSAPAKPQTAAVAPSQGDDELLGPDTGNKQAKKPSAPIKPGPARSGNDKLLAPGKDRKTPQPQKDALARPGKGQVPREPQEPEPATPAARDTSDGYKTSKPGDPEGKDKKKKLSADEEHVKLFVENRYPSANTCGTCHPRHYKEWSVSQHAYAQLSPVYLSLNNKINSLTNGSNGDFCLRCHSPVGANLGESPFASNLDRHPASREGITCVVCHRINKAYNKVSGRLALVEGGLTEPVFGPTGNAGLKQTLAKPEKFRVVTDPKDPGRQIHKEAKLFQAIKTSTFCGSCHDVTLFNGFRLEEAFSEYRVSPAAAKGITCQDCHMGKIQGKPSGYHRGPAAVVGEVPTKSRKLTSHLFSGPDYPIVHPGIFPHNTEAAQFKTLREWLQFDHKAGWGTDKFENSRRAAKVRFPKTWQSVDDRYDAREILKKQFKLLKFARKKRLEILRNGFLLHRVVTDRADNSGISFRVKVKNGTDGHNVPTGFTGERLVWLDVIVTDREGTVIFRSGDRDPNGDIRDGHSSYVHAGKVKLDRYLFSLQSIFVTQNGRGGEIEHIIPIPYPVFALPRVLPSTTSLIFTGEPATERVHKKGIEPNGHRWASYKVSADALTGKGPYKAIIKLNAQAVPINLISEIQDVGFDFGMTPRQVGDAIIAGTETLWRKKLVFDIPSEN